MHAQIALAHRPEGQQGRWRSADARRLATRWRHNIGSASAAPLKIGVSPGAIISTAATQHTACSVRVVSTKNHFDNAAASSMRPSTQPTKVTTKS